MFFVSSVCNSVFFFFFQAEDGIRDIGVTGVQTCALPICPDARLLLGWRGSGLLGPARGAGREVLDADAPQQPKRPRRAGRLALLASGPDPQAASRLARAAHRWCRLRCGSTAWPTR